ncbi:MAG: helix-turn-helix domain-containing protein [Glaciecola sp.]
MKTLEEIVKSLKGKNHADIARKAGMTRAYVNALSQGKHLNPRYETIRKLSEVLSNEE